MRALTLVLASVVLLCLPTMLAGPALPSSPWRTELVSLDALGGEHSLAIGDDGQVFAAWTDFGTTPKHSYVAELAGAWTIIDEVIDARSPSVAVDDAGSVHILFQTPTGIVHKWRDDVGWSTETVQAASYSGIATHLEIAPDGTLHALYDRHFCMTHAERQEGVWLTQVLTCSSTISNTGLAIGPDGTPHAILKPGSLEHWKRVGGTWSSSPIGSGSFSGIGVDASGAAHIAFIAPGDVLSYARESGGSYEIGPVPGAGLAAWPSIAVSEDGTPHISYRDRFSSSLTNGHLRYSTRGVDGTWTHTLVDPEGVASDSTIRLDQTNTPRILYGYLWDQAAEALRGDLRFAEPVAAVPARALFAVP